MRRKNREMHSVNMIILAKGESARIRKGKAFLRVGKDRILDDMLSKLKGIKASDEEIILVTNFPSLYKSYHVKIARDIISNRGPLGAIYTGLLVSRALYNFILACDMPFISTDLIQYMCQKEKDYHILVPRYQNYFEPLHAIYSRSILPHIKENLDQGIFKIQSLFSKVKTRYIQEEELNLFGNLRSFFFNVNKEADLRRAREKHHRDGGINSLFQKKRGETVRVTEARI